MRPLPHLVRLPCRGPPFQEVMRPPPFKLAKQIGVGTLRRSKPEVKKERTTHRLHTTHSLLLSCVCTHSLRVRPLCVHTQDKSVIDDFLPRSRFLLVFQEIDENIDEHNRERGRKSQPGLVAEEVAQHGGDEQQTHRHAVDPTVAFVLLGALLAEAVGHDISIGKAWDLVHDGVGIANQIVEHGRLRFGPTQALLRIGCFRLDLLHAELQPEGPHLLELSKTKRGKDK